MPEAAMVDPPLTGTQIDNRVSDAAPSGQSGRAILQASSVTKVYGVATVLNAVTIEVFAGEVHAIVGENGAGKSTIAKIIAGVVTPDDGVVEFDGAKVATFSVHEAERRGIVLIHQELALAEHLSVVENMFLGHEVHRRSILSTKIMRERAGSMLAQLGCDIDPRRLASSLSISEKQMVEVAKALLREAKLIIMDEPTAVLTPPEIEHLFEQIERLRASGLAIIYVSHRLDEVKRIADRVTVLRDGVKQGTWSAAELSTGEIARLMVGRELQEIYPPRSRAPDRVVRLALTDLLGSESARPASFDVLSGEILGVAGLVGAGRTELFETIVGLRPRKGGSAFLGGEAFAPRTYRDSVARGVVYITEDRKKLGLLLQESVPVNISLLDQVISRARFIDDERQKDALAWAVSKFNIAMRSPRVRVAQLSGGNQQKTLLAKSLFNSPSVVIFDEPTRGIDVGTRAQIYRQLRELADAGTAVVVISSDMAEVIGLSDRVMVMRANDLVGFLEGDAITEENIVHLATSVAHIAAD